MGGFGAKPGLMEKAAEKAKKVFKDIPGADTIKELPKLERSLDILPVPGLRLMPLRLGPLGRLTTEDKPTVLMALTEKETGFTTDIADYAYSLFLEPARTIPGSETWLAWAGMADAPVVRLPYNESIVVNAPSLMNLPEADLSSVATESVFKVDQAMRGGRPCGDRWVL